MYLNKLIVKCSREQNKHKHGTGRRWRITELFVDMFWEAPPWKSGAVQVDPTFPNCCPRWGRGGLQQRANSHRSIKMIDERRQGSGRPFDTWAWLWLPSESVRHYIHASTKGCPSVPSASSGKSPSIRLRVAIHNNPFIKNGIPICSRSARRGAHRLTTSFCKTLQNSRRHYLM